MKRFNDWLRDNPFVLLLIMCSLGFVAYSMRRSPTSAQENNDAAVAAAMRYFEPCAQQARVNVFDSQSCNEDLRRIEAVAKTDVEGDALDQLITSFFRIVTRPLQMGCRKLRRIGLGVFHRGPGAWDGHKFICEDDFPADDEDCLVYSFGISTDFSFEEAMAVRGCQVNAYDPTVSAVRSTAGANLIVTRKGVAPENSRNFKTLDTFLRVNNHTDYVIDYLKVDIEGAEIKVMKGWIKSGVLKNVQQIGVEFHHVTTRIRSYFEILQGLYELGYKAIAFDPNLSTMPAGEEGSGKHDFFEILFRRVDVRSVCKAILEERNRQRMAIGGGRVR